jgi:hypothetical protein
VTLLTFRQPLPDDTTMRDGSVANIGETIPLRLIDGETVDCTIVEAVTSADGRSLDITLDVPRDVAERLRPPSRPGDYSLERS